MTTGSPSHKRFSPGNKEWTRSTAGYNVASANQSAALRGASAAFVKPPSKTKPLVNSYSGNSGALAAAKRAGNGESTYGDGRPSFSSRSYSEAQVPRQSESVGVNSLHISTLQETSRSRSPSNIAAALAAARSTTQTPHSLGTEPRVLPIIQCRSVFHTRTNDRHHDVLPNEGTVRNVKKRYTDNKRASPGGLDGPESLNLGPATTALIEKVERYQGLNGHDSNALPFPRPTVSGIYTRSPRAVSQLSLGIPALSATEDTVQIQPLIQPTKSSNPAVQNSKVISNNVTSVRLVQPMSGKRSVLLAPAEHHHVTNPETSNSLRLWDARPSHSTDIISSRMQPSQENQELQTMYANAGASQSSPDLHFNDVHTIASSVSASVSPHRPRPTLPPPRRRSNQSRNMQISNNGATLNDVNDNPPGTKPLGQTTAVATKLHAVPLPCPLSRAASSYRELPPQTDRGRQRQKPNRAYTSHMTEESLANAIVASSLASSRRSSPTISPAPNPPLRQSKPHHLFHHHRGCHTPSPPKGMRQTMRALPNSEDEEEGLIGSHRRGRKHFIKKHPNKHHEGDRKRWKDQVTERERRRYEGVWAANRGAHVVLPNVDLRSVEPSRMPISNLVIRDIWSRSRLGDDLEQVWDLVDRDASGVLSKEEFVVGMWLVDQRLKGRKLPIRVSESVWRSVGRLGDIKVPKHRS
ncbi:MAG: Increased rDNA silencing protein [Pycnora praestabilis]|nr:MAG: Increased rDNA silencing protein [Pycnora praestabilis]